MKLERLLLACCLLSGIFLSTQLQADPVKRYVTLDGTRLLSKPAAFSKSYGSLRMGQAVMAEKGPNGYYKVSILNAENLHLKKSTGYLSARALQEDRPKIGSGARASSDASAEEVAAATKGFNKQIEADYGKQNSKLDYDLVSKLESRTQMSDPQNSLASFREKGKLGEYAPGNKDNGKGGDDE
jgi:hypothetical protein